VLERRDGTTRGLVGLTGHGVEVVFDGPDTLMRRVTRVRVTGVEADAVSATLAAPQKEHA
jgi:hypothetical protein